MTSVSKTFRQIDFLGSVLASNSATISFPCHEEYQAKYDLDKFGSQKLFGSIEDDHLKFSS